MGCAGPYARAQVGNLTGVDAATVRRWFDASAAVLHDQRDYLTQLDAAIGDADHGTNMDRGFASVVTKLGDTEDSTPPGRLLVTAGSTLISTVGGASGPLWGTALRRAGKAIGDAEEFDGPALAAAFEAALDGVVELGAAHLGDKTMVDALEPANGASLLAFVNGLGGTPLIELYVVYNELAKQLAERGLTATRSLVGNYITSLEMAGISITLLELDEELTALWDAPVHTPALRWGV